MRMLVLFAAVAALSACSQKSDETPEPTAATTETATPAAPATASAGTQPGTYDVKMADGTMATTVINADGTYVDTDPKGVVTKGAFASRDGKDCFDPEGDEGEVCWTSSTPAADGSFTATDPKGTVVTVTRKKV